MLDVMILLLSMQAYRTTPLRGRNMTRDVSSLSDDDFLSESDSFELYQQRVRDGDFDPYDMGWNNSESFEEEIRPIQRAPRQTSRCVPEMYYFRRKEKLRENLSISVEKLREN